ncbi:hypothetical protein LJK88_13665 [Paenibacillus sp. P26]|nr:hypothetical protein LJK88_13665 [Paenibacillus sp. P26]UUZ97912.1 hypothetical protein LJK87_24040 [Paenibacillus sp. P25]
MNLEKGKIPCNAITEQVAVLAEDVCEKASMVMSEAEDKAGIGALLAQKPGSV